MPDSCSLTSQPGEDGSVVVHANFTMRPDPNMDSIIGQTAHNLDEVSTASLTHDKNTSLSLSCGVCRPLPLPGQVFGIT